MKELTKEQLESLEKSKKEKAKVIKSKKIVKK
jgi:hypothetical protein